MAHRSLKGISSWVRELMMKCQQIEEQASGKQVRDSSILLCVPCDVHQARGLVRHSHVECPYCLTWSEAS